MGVVGEREEGRVRVGMSEGMGVGLGVGRWEEGWLMVWEGKEGGVEEEGG